MTPDVLPGIKSLNRPYDIDFCLCIDKTDSMRSCFPELKEFIAKLDPVIRNSFTEKGKQIDGLRIRLVFFGDSVSDPEPVITSPFFAAHDKEALLSFFDNIPVGGGGDTAKNGLEALAYGIRSDWVKTEHRKRHIIILFTDGVAHALSEKEKALSFFPYGMPENFGQLTEMWGDVYFPGEMDNIAKRLLLFAPDTSFWHTINEAWNNSVIKPISDSSDLTCRSIMDALKSF